MNQRKFRLTPGQRETIAWDLASEHPKIQRRAQALKLLDEGKNVTEVAQTLGVSRQSVYKWIRAYGIDQDDEQQLAEAILAALQEQEWTFEAFHAALEQRLGRTIATFHLRYLTLYLWSQVPSLHRVVGLMG